MSYTRHFSGSVHYSGSKRVSYPASEHGGSITVHYSGDIPVNMNVHVDTEPFDESVNGTKTALGVVTGAVVATEAAQVAQVNASANQISKTAINGFYHVVSSELSARASESSSAMGSSVGLLTKEAEDVDRIHGQMDTDYRAIKARYLRIFNRLDSELERRIKELDRPAFELGMHGMRGVVQQPYEEYASTTFMQSQDAHNTPLKLLCGRTKGRVLSALRNLGNMCGYISQYDRTVNGIMSDYDEEAEAFVPVVYALQSDAQTSNERLEIHDPQTGRSADVKRRVESYVASMPEHSWQEPKTADQAALDNSFAQLVAEYSAQTEKADAALDHERVSRQIMELYKNARLKTSYGN